MVKIMETLRNDHRNMSKLLNMLEEQIGHVASDETPDFALVDEIINYCLTYPDHFHHPKEDVIYRALIEKGANPNEIGDMEIAHEELSGLTHRLAELTKLARNSAGEHRSALASLLESFVRSYRLHIDAEDKIFFPMAERMLTSHDWNAIEAEIEIESDPLFHENVPVSHLGFGQLLRDRIKKMSQIVSN